jgi:hypothetical protein
MSDSIFYNLSGSPEISWYKIWSPVKSRFSGGKRVDYEYSETGQLVQENIQLFDTLGGSWRNGQIASYLYNAEGLVQQKLLKTWDTAGFWRDSLRVGYLYNNDKLLTQTVHEIINQAQQWENYWKWEYNYNTNDKIREEFQYSWDSVAWENKNYTVYSYENSLLIQTLRMVWDENELVWVNKNRTSYTYNSNGQRTEVLGEYYDQYSMIWFRSYTYSYTYDENGNRTEFIYRIWDEPNGEWINFYKESSYWSEFELFAINENTWLNARIYPNPASNEVQIQVDETIKSGTCSLMALDGKMIFKTQFSGNTLWFSTGFLQPGNYIVIIETEMGYNSQNLIIGK